MECRRGRGHRVDVVVRHEHDAARGAGRDAGRVGRRDVAAPIVDTAEARVEQDVVEVAVVGALELDEPVAAGMGPNEAQRDEHRLGARVDEADAVRGRDHRDDELRGLDHLGREVEVVRDPIRLACDRGHERGMAVAEDDGARAEDHVEQPVPVGRPDVGAVAALDDEVGRIHERREPARAGC